MSGLYDDAAQISSLTKVLQPVNSFNFYFAKSQNRYHFHCLGDISDQHNHHHHHHYYNHHLHHHDDNFDLAPDNCKGDAQPSKSPSAASALLYLLLMVMMMMTMLMMMMMTMLTMLMMRRRRRRRMMRMMMIIHQMYSNFG